MTLLLFAPTNGSADGFQGLAERAHLAWRSLWNDEPILSGRHGLHLYHGYLGAHAWWLTGTSCCYDAAFQAGYPKTPVFDSGCRPAELALILAGGTYQPAAYKITVAGCLLALPILFFAAGRWAGLGNGPSNAATALGLLVLWSTPGWRLVEAGDLDLMLAGLAGVLQTGLLIRADRRPGLSSWTMLVCVAALGWFAQPIFFAGCSLLVLVYYFRAGVRHSLSWHLALWGSLLAGLATQASWLPELVSQWWIRSPLRLSAPVLPHRTLPTIWGAPLWGDAPDRLLIGFVVAAAGAGIWLLNERGRRPAARLFGLGAAGLLSLAVIGLAWEALSLLGTTHLLAPALWFAVFPAGFALARGCAEFADWLGRPWRGVAVGLACLAVTAVLFHDRMTGWASRAAGIRSLQIGLNAQQQELVSSVSAYTTAAGRILWEDHVAAGQKSHWTALLPILTGRQFIGGLDLDRCIEHSYPAFTEQTLAGRPISDWTDGELEEMSARYALGWVACWSPAAVARFRAWPAAREAAPLAGDGRLFVLPPRSIARRGQAVLLHCDCQRIVLGDVTPDPDGCVLLSFHHHGGMRAVPSRIQVEREPDPHDPIPFVRLRMNGSVSRVTLTWRHE